MKKLILVKLGGSLITDKTKPFTDKKNVIKRLSSEIHSARKILVHGLILGHGGGSYPHVPAKKFKTAEGVVDKNSYKGIAEVQDAAAKLNRIVVRALLDVGESAISLSPSSLMVSDKGRPKKMFTDSLNRIMEFNMLPVFYGDVVLDESWGCSILSTEVILTYLATVYSDQYKIEKLIYCGITNGVYDEHGETIRFISPKNFSDVKDKIHSSEGIDVTGGMIHKVQESLALASKLKINTLIINGNVKGELERALLGKKVKGTIVSL